MRSTVKPRGNKGDGASPSPDRLRAAFLGDFRGYTRHKWLVLIFLPGLLYYIVFHYVPMYGLLIAFKDYRFKAGIIGSPWVGLEHFRHLFALGSFWEVFRNTVIISSLKLLFSFPAPIVLALLFNEVRALAVKKVLQTVSYLPHFVSWVILSGVLTQILSPSTGMVNRVIAALGGRPVYFLADPDWFRGVLVTTTVWKEIGWGSIIYIASIANINPEMYESASMDGANRFRQLWHITLPSLAPVITIMLILAMGRLINDDFDQIFNLYNPAVYRVADVISTYTYRIGLINMEYSFATAVGIFKNVISLALLITANRVATRVNQYGLY
jgi:putative aldouronate transport system permease protein